MSDWHGSTCRKVDLIEQDGISFCAGCGSVQDVSEDRIWPAIDPLKQIRLLRIRKDDSGDSDAAVCCDFVVTDIDELPSYHAISYTWATEDGDATKSRMIYVGNKPLNVTVNCRGALQRARSADLSLVWIDAVCINQAVMAERGHQVRLMGKVYENARSVIIDIGEPDEGSDNVMQYLHDLIHHPFRCQPVPIKDYLSFMKRRYWRRVWVLQEITLARVAHVICGRWKIPWALFTIKTLMNMRLEYPRVPASIRSAQHDREIRGIPPVMRTDLRHFSATNDFLGMLAHTSSCQASDPRDKVYGLLGLWHESQLHNLIPDYSLSVPQLYARVAVILSRSAGDAQVLTYACQEQKTKGIPSWAPDWTCLSRLEVDRPIRTYQFSAQHRRVFARFDEENLSLSLTGVDIGPIQGLDLVGRTWGDSILRHDTSHQKLDSRTQFHLFMPCDPEWKNGSYPSKWHLLPGKQSIIAAAKRLDATIPGWVMLAKYRKAGSSLDSLAQFLYWSGEPHRGRSVAQSSPLALLISRVSGSDSSRWRYRGLLNLNQLWGKNLNCIGSSEDAVPIHVRHLSYYGIRWDETVPGENRWDRTVFETIPDPYMMDYTEEIKDRSRMAGVVNISLI